MLISDRLRQTASEISETARARPAIYAASITENVDQVAALMEQAADAIDNVERAAINLNLQEQRVARATLDERQT